MTIKQVELIGKKEFVAATLDPEHEGFVIHVAVLGVDLGDQVHLSRRPQIAHLKANEAFFEVPSKYADFVDVFFLKLAAKLSEHGRINNHDMELEDD